MGNIFPPNKDIHEVYDLKGSFIGRMYPEEKALNNPRAVLKDKNWVKRNKTLYLGPEKSKLLIEQMERDVQVVFVFFLICFLVFSVSKDYGLFSSCWHS
jgi:1-phosphatidylinositol-4-phosphate 5-kinase